MSKSLTKKLLEGPDAGGPGVLPTKPDAHTPDSAWYVSFDLDLTKGEQDGGTTMGTLDIELQPTARGEALLAFLNGLERTILDYCNSNDAVKDVTISR